MEREQRGQREKRKSAEIEPAEVGQTALGHRNDEDGDLDGDQKPPRQSRRAEDECDRGKEVEQADRIELQDKSRLLRGFGGVRAEHLPLLRRLERGCEKASQTPNYECCDGGVELPACRHVRTTLIERVVLALGFEGVFMKLVCRVH